MKAFKVILFGLVLLSFICSSSGFCSPLAETQERTFAIIKPDAVASHHLGGILSKLEQEQLLVVGMKMLQLSAEQAEQFYAVHKERPFFKDLTEYMRSGPVVVLVLEGKDAVAHYREVMGSTDPKKASPNTLRALFGKSIQENAVHGSDSKENAAIEIAFFFSPDQIVKR